jgi:S-adenosylmethionine synthetase
VLVQVAYAIGVAEPMGIFIDTYGTCDLNLTDGEIAEQVSEIFDMRPYAIVERFELRPPIYSETAAYGHMGRKTQVVEKTFTDVTGKKVSMEVKLFPWEELNYVEKVRAKFDL